MKLLLHLPSDPRYFGSTFTKFQIDRAICRYDELTGALSAEGSIGAVPSQFQLLRGGGVMPMISFYTNGFPPALPMEKDLAIDRLLAMAQFELQRHIEEIIKLLKLQNRTTRKSCCASFTPSKTP